MLSRIRSSRGIISIRPWKLPVRAVPRNFDIQRLPSGTRTYAQDAGEAEAVAEPHQPILDDRTTQHGRSSDTAEPSATAQQPEPAVGDDAHVESATAPRQQTRVNGAILPLDPVERRKAQARMRAAESYQRKMARLMPCPVGMSEKEFNAMTIEQKIKLRNELRESMTEEQKAGIGYRTAMKRAMDMECPEGISAEEFSQLTPEVRLALFLQGRKDRKKWKPSKNSQHAAELSLEALRLEEEGEIKIEPKPRKKRSDAGITKKAIFSASRKKMPSRGVKAIQYQYDVVKAMRDAGVELEGNALDFAGGGIVSATDKSRMNIMSRPLIDDVLERLGPSLEKHKGCDLIDINPGIGLWSSKLHDILKPRSHIMMEPDKMYHRQLKTLVDKDPTYKLLPLSGVIWQNLLKIEEEKMLPHQTWRRLGDPELDKPNDTLLVTINLGYYPRRSYLGFASLTHLVLHQLFTATRAHSIFQAYGQVRMLVWVHDFEKRIIVPRTLALRKKSSLEAETCCEYIHEICGADGFAEASQRGRDINLESARRVRKKMDEAGISNAPHRMSKLEADMKELIDSHGDLSGRVFDRGWYVDYELLTKGLVEKKFPMYINPTTGENVYYEQAGDLEQRAPNGFGDTQSPEYAKWSELKHRFTSEGNQEGKVLASVSLYDELEAQWLEVSKSTTLTEEEKSQQLQEIESRIAKWVEALENQTIFRRTRISQHISERIAISQDPPILEWDRRPFEPLVVKPEEFLPRQEMALLDIQPRTIWPSLAKNDMGDYDYYELLLSCLCLLPGKSIVDRLKSFAPGADEWILPRCKTLRDVEKGGMINLEMLTVRNMSEEMLREVFEQFMKWPFRPTKGRMLQMMGSTSVHEQDSEENAASGLHSW